jgi:hypothetical protein
MDINIYNWPAVKEDIQRSGIFDLIPLDRESYAFITGSEHGYRVSDTILSDLRSKGEKIPVPLEERLRRYVA